MYERGEVRGITGVLHVSAHCYRNTNTAVAVHRNAMSEKSRHTFVFGIVVRLVHTDLRKKGSVKTFSLTMGTL